MTLVWIDLLVAYLAWGVGLVFHQSIWPGRDYSYLETRDKLYGDARLHYDRSSIHCPELMSVLSVFIIVLLWLPGMLVDIEKNFKD